MSDTTPSKKSSSSSSSSTPEPNSLPTTPPFCCPHAILIPNPSLKNHLWGDTISHFLSTARSSSTSTSSPSAIKTGSPETVAEVMRFCASFVKVVILSGGSSSPSSSTRDGNMAHGVEERGRRGEGRGEEAAFYVQAMLKDRSGAVWMGVEYPSFSASSGSSSDSSSSPATSTSSSISSPPEEGSIETSALRMEFTRSDAAVILFCGEHSKVYKVEVWEDKEKIRALFLESEEEKEVVVERGEDGVARVGLFVGAGEEGEMQVDEEEGGEVKKGRAGEEEVVVD